MGPIAITFLSATAALIPAALFFVIVWWADQYEKEPVPLVLAVFLWGAVPSAIISLLLRSIFEFPLTVVVGETNSDQASIIILAPIIEESVKALALVGLLFLRRDEIDTPLDGIIYGAMVGLGFGFVENTLYFMSHYAAIGSTPWVLIVVRGWMFGLTHALFSAIVGLGVAVGRLSPNRTKRYAAPLAAWAIAVVFHMLHNIGVESGGLACGFALLFNWGSVWLAVLIVLLSLRQERNWIRQYLPTEALHHTTLTHQQLAIAESTRSRFGAVNEAFFKHGWKRFRLVSGFYHRCSELAYLKHHLEVHPTDENAAALDTKRAEVKVLSEQLRRIEQTGT